MGLFVFFEISDHVTLGTRSRLVPGGHPPDEGVQAEHLLRVLQQVQRLWQGLALMRRLLELTAHLEAALKCTSQLLSYVPATPEVIHNEDG